MSIYTDWQMEFKQIDVLLSFFVLVRSSGQITLKNMYEAKKS